MSAVGVDGCPGGWVAVELTPEGWRWEVAEEFATLLEAFPGARRLLIDIPIGLHEAGREERRCDRKARRLLGRPRSSSVFPVPLRPVLEVADHATASARQRKLGGRGLSIQSFHLTEGIRELDELLGHRPVGSTPVRESHPEVAFWALAGMRPMTHPKRKPAGRAERLVVLAGHEARTREIVVEALERYPRRLVAADDVIDALCLAITADRDRLATLPAEPEMDSRGLPMEIVYAAP